MPTLDLPAVGGNTPPALTPTQAIHYLRRLIALDGAFFPCMEECRHHACEVELRVLAILERVK